MMNNLMALAAEDMEAVDAALTTLETRLAGLIALRVDGHHALAKMSRRSEKFCNRTLMLLALNPQIVPSDFDLAEAQAGLAAMDVLRPRLLRLRRLGWRAEDSEAALCSDVMSAALGGHALLKVLDCYRPAMRVQSLAAPGAIEAMQCKAMAQHSDIRSRA
jgi:hypothetical protein